MITKPPDEELTMQAMERLWASFANLLGPGLRDLRLTMTSDGFVLDVKTESQGGATMSRTMPLTKLTADERDAIIDRLTEMREQLSVAH